MRFYRRNGRQKLLTPDQQPRAAKAKVETNGPLVEAVVKAFRWQEQIDSGKYAGIEEMAKELGVDRSYVARMVRIASLAPDIVEAILNGQEPSGLSLRRLHKDIPVCWQEQRLMWEAQHSTHGR